MLLATPGMTAPAATANEACYQRLLNQVLAAGRGKPVSSKSSFSCSFSSCCGSGLCAQRVVASYK